MNTIQKWMQPGYFFKGSQQRKALVVAGWVVVFYIILFAALCMFPHHN